MVTLQSGTFSRDPTTGAVVFKPNTMVSKAAVSPQVVARQQQQAPVTTPVYSEATAKKPFTSAQLIPKTTTTETLRPSDIDLAIMGSPIGATHLASGLIQISDFYLGGRSIQKTTEKIGAPVSERIVGTPVVTTREITGGTEVTTTTPVTTTTKTPTERTVVSTPIESGFESVQKSISERAYSGIASITGTSQEAVKAGVKVSALISEEMANKSPTLLNIQRAMGTSEIRSTLEKPLEAGLYFGAGVGFGVATKGAGIALKRTQLIAEPILESESARNIAPRLASTIGTQIVEKGPKLLTALYAADVAGRVTEGGKNLGLGSIAAKSAPIATQEIIPLGAGFGTVERAGTLVKEAKAGYSGYKAMLSERVATTPILTLTPTEEKLAVGQIVPERPTIGGYAKYEAQKSIPMSIYDTLDYIRSGKGLTRDIRNIPARIGIAADVTRGTILETAPEYMYRAGERAYRAQEFVAAKAPIVAERFGKILAGERGVTTIQRPPISFGETKPSIVEGIYSRYFTAKITAPVAVERAIISGETKLWEVMQKAKTPRISVESAIQESGYSIGWEGAPRYTYTLKQAKPQFIAIGDVGDFKPSGGTIKPSVGGAGIRVETRPSFERITTKMVGGTKVSGLVTERPVKSIESIGETTLGRTRSIGQSADYRSKPLSGTMKPIGKQATGISVLSEELPGVSKSSQIAAPTGQRAVAFAPLTIEREVKPSYAERSEFTRISGIRSFTTSVLVTPRQQQIPAPISEVKEKARTRTFIAEVDVLRAPITSPTVGISPKIASEIKPITTTRLSYESTQKRIPVSDTIPDVARREITEARRREDIRTRLDTVIGGKTDVTQRYTQITEPRIYRKPVYEFKTYTGQSIGSYLGVGGGGGEGGRRRGRFAFRETLSVRGLLGIGKSATLVKEKQISTSEYYKRGRIGRKITFEKVKPSSENVDRLYTRSGGKRKLVFKKVRSISPRSIW